MPGTLPQDSAVLSVTSEGGCEGEEAWVIVIFLCLCVLSCILLGLAAGCWKDGEKSVWCVLGRGGYLVASAASC